LFTGYDLLRLKVSTDLPNNIVGIGVEDAADRDEFNYVESSFSAFILRDERLRFI